MAETRQPIRMIYFVSDGIFAPVLDSQVLMPLNVVGRVASDIRRALLILTSIRHKKSAKVPSREQEIVGSLSDAKILFKYRLILAIPFEQRLWAGRLRQAIRECGYTGDDPIIVHCRGQSTAAAAVLARKRDPRIRILLDIRGAQTDEIKKSGWLGRYLKRSSDRMFALALTQADAINTVSNKLMDHLRETGLFNQDVPRSIIACCVDTKRFYYDPALREATRRELGLEGKFVMCYCGAMSHWQRPDAVAAAFDAVRQDMPDAHMFVVSHEAGPLIEHLKRLGIGSEFVTVRAASHDKVAPYLMAGDVGMLLREDTLTNRVAAPVKFAEYLRCGLPVILTPYVGDFAEYVVNDGLGGVTLFPVEPSDMVRVVRGVRDRLSYDGDTFRLHCSHWAEKRLSWDGQIMNLVRIYRQLAGT